MSEQFIKNKNKNKKCIEEIAMVSYFNCNVTIIFHFSIIPMDSVLCSNAIKLLKSDLNLVIVTTRDRSGHFLQISFINFV